MAINVTPRLVELTYEAALKSYWRKKALKKFLRACYISDNYLATWDLDLETKRNFLDRAFTKLQTTKKGKAVILEMAKNLTETKSFPDLRYWEDSKVKIAQAKRAVGELKVYLEKKAKRVEEEARRKKNKKKARQRRAKIQRSQLDKEKLQRRLDELHTKVGTQEGGYEFERWFYDFLDYFEIDNRRPYHSKGRQMDGAITHEGTTYIVELKFKGKQVGVKEISSLDSKVRDKADNTMGIIVSMSGFSSVAIDSASGPRSLLLLLNAQHIYMSLSGPLQFNEIITRVRRHASQTGESYLEVAEFGG